eukprot:Rmarinus@m.4555
MNTMMDPKTTKDELDLLTDDFEDLVCDDGEYGNLDDGEGDEDDLCIVDDSGADEQEFDTVVGHLEDILMETDFVQCQTEFLDSHCDEYEDTEENKLCYWDHFKQYTNLIERYIETRLAEEIAGFTMEKMAVLLSSRKPEELEGDVFEMLMSLSDFQSFKELMIDHKKGRQMQQSGQDKFFLSCIDVRPVGLHHDEQEDGIARPDLNLDIKPLTPEPRPMASTLTPDEDLQI